MTIFLPGLPGGSPSSPFVATLGGSISLVFLVDGGASIADVPHNVTSAKGARSGVPVVRAVDRNESRVLSGHMHIEGFGKDDAIAQIAAINAMLRAGTTLEIQSVAATYSVTINILPSPLSCPPLGDPQWEVGAKCLLPFTFLCEPYAYGPLTTILANQQITYPASVDITVPGDYPTPLIIDFSGAGIHCLYAGLLPDQVSEAALWDGESTAASKITWSGGTSSDIVDGNAHGGKARQGTSGNIYGSVVDTALLPGTYKILGRHSQSGAGASGFELGGTNVSLGAVGWTISEGASVRLPQYKVISPGASTFTGIEAWPSTADPYIDYVTAVPQTWGWASYHASGAGNCTYLTVGADGTMYVDRAAAGSVARCGGMNAVGDQRMYVVADVVAGGGSGTLTLWTAISAIPRYALWR